MAHAYVYVQVSNRTVFSKAIHYDDFAYFGDVLFACTGPQFAGAEHAGMGFLLGCTCAQCSVQVFVAPNHTLLVSEKWQEVYFATTAVPLMRDMKCMRIKFLLAAAAPPAASRPAAPRTVKEVLLNPTALCCHLRR